MFPFIHQPDSMDCGPACLSMVAKHYGKDYTLDSLRKDSYIGKEGVSLLGISRAAEKIGFRTVGGRITYDKLVEKALLPCIVHWNQEHFVVVYDTPSNSPERGGFVSTITKLFTSPTSLWRQGKNDVISVADPGKGLLTYTKEEFCSHWLSTKTNGEDKGVVLLLEPTNLFYEQEDNAVPTNNRLQFLWKYIVKYKRFFWQLILGLLLGSVLIKKKQPDFRTASTKFTFHYKNTKSFF